MNKSKEYQDLVPLVDQQQFKQVIGHFASGVSIITVSNNGVDFGITASAVCSVSVDPPMLLVCVNKSTGTCHAISAAESFTVNIVNETQKELALRFARANTDKFDGVDFSYGELGNPVLGQTLATLECRVVEEVTGGTHSVFLGEVQMANAADGDPLVYYRGKFGKFEEA
ncbi:flavin reductase family protein [Priestia megaterium]|jgi:4-nitrophenol 2-monooxygenase / 4-nitrocatechol 4-monooxygenase, reductase component|uniref:Flavin reductase family protein n=1 Tax=Priestia megaterium TaxID=1404 RepID=A0A6H1P645_PRIMG|nr:flavin reductase family protein [Priestia megaterium]QIZ09013.1 flavin reductase family protein [Priestia megaterium]